MSSNITYKLKRGTDTALKRANPILAAGEPIVVFGQEGNIWLKIGDGKTPYTELSLCTQIPDNISIKYDKDKISLAGFSTADSSTIPFKTDDNTMEWVSIDFISSNTKLEYNSNTGEIQLCSLSGEVISTLDAAEFAIAGLIEDIGYDAGNNVLVFVWNTANGRKTSTIPLDNMLSPYIEGNGIKIVGNNISVQASPNSEKFLFIDKSGIGIKGIQDALDLISVNCSEQTDSIYMELDSLDNQIESLSTEISNLSDSVRTLENQDIQGIIDDSLVEYVKSSDIEDAIEEATKDLNISLEKIDGGRITDVAINES